MKLKHTALWSGVVAAALLLTACGKSNSGSGSMSSSGMSSSTASTAQNGAWKTGLGVLTETTDDHRTGTGDFIGATIEAGCDAFITGELKHNEFIESKECGFTVIEAGHFATENPVVEALAARLREEIENEIIVIGQEAPEKYIK